MRAHSAIACMLKRATGAYAVLRERLRRAKQATSCPMWCGSQASGAGKEHDSLSFRREESAFPLDKIEVRARILPSQSPLRGRWKVVHELVWMRECASWANHCGSKPFQATRTVPFKHFNVDLGQTSLDMLSSHCI
jgi:hypothetical protein